MDNIINIDICGEDNEKCTTFDFEMDSDLVEQFSRIANYRGVSLEEAITDAFKTVVRELEEKMSEQ